MLVDPRGMSKSNKFGVPSEVMETPFKKKNEEGKVTNRGKSRERNKGLTGGEDV